MRQIDFVKKLKHQLLTEFQTQSRNGVYGYTQRNMAYNSNRIEGSTLTVKQTASIFETGTICMDEENLFVRTKDIEEMTGHFKMFNYMLQHMDEPLSETMICEMHKQLKEGVFEDAANGYAIGAYKTRANFVADIQTSSPQDVAKDMQVLLTEYHNIQNPSLQHLAKLHAKFENIHPFQDGNGRVGRMILLHECLYHNIAPILVHNQNKQEYIHYLNLAQTKEQYRGLCQYFAKEQETYLNDTLPFVYDYQELQQMDPKDFITTDTMEF